MGKLQQAYPVLSRKRPQVGFVDGTRGLPSLHRLLYLEAARWVAGRFVEVPAADGKINMRRGRPFLTLLLDKHGSVHTHGVRVGERQRRK